MNANVIALLHAKSSNKALEPTSRPGAMTQCARGITTLRFRFS